MKKSGGKPRASSRFLYIGVMSELKEKAGALPAAAQTVWLVGLMGAGKSAVGRKLATRLGREFIDADLEIERSAHCSVSEIFAREGEAAFRERERECIGTWAGRAAIVALGGGAMSQPGIPEILADAGRCVYLRARPETLAARVGAGEGRPLLEGLDADGRLAKLSELLEKRSAAYEAAELAVDTDGCDAEAVALAICDALGEVTA